MAHRAPKGSQTKGESITVRITPKLKFGLELLARKQKRTISSVIEWAIDRALQDPRDGLKVYGLDPHLEQANVLESTWSPYESDRLVNLATLFPMYLTYEEDRLWTFINEESDFWEEDPMTGVLGSIHPKRKLIRACWEMIKEHVENKAPFDRNKFAEIQTQVAKKE